MALTDQQTTVVGQGINNPVTFPSFKQNQLLELVSGQDIINQSIHDIMATRIGERINNVEYGSNIMDLIFEPNDQILRDLLYYNAYTVISRWEKRITITDIKIFSDDEAAKVGNTTDYTGGNLVNVVISYIINSSHQPGSYVFPFARSAATTASLTQGKESGIFGYPISKG